MRRAADSSQVRVCVRQKTIIFPLCVPRFWRITVSDRDVAHFPSYRAYLKNYNLFSLGAPRFWSYSAFQKATARGVWDENVLTAGVVFRKAGDAQSSYPLGTGSVILSDPINKLMFFCIFTPGMKRDL